MRILHVEDDATSRLILESGLTASIPECSIHAVSTAEEGLEALRCESYDLVLTDLNLPKASGLEVVKTAHETIPRPVVIVLTGHGSVESAVEAIRLGACDYIQKPVNIELLTRRVENIIAHGLRCAEAEEYRLVKEMVESTAANDIQILEHKLCRMHEAIDQAITLLENQSAPVSRSLIEALLELLLPFGRSGKHLGEYDTHDETGAA